MTQELLLQAIELDRKIEQCEMALNYMAHGTYYRHADGENTLLPLPLEVAEDIRTVIDKWKKSFENKLEEL